MIFQPRCLAVLPLFFDVTFFLWNLTLMLESGINSSFLWNLALIYLFFGVTFFFNFGPGRSCWFLAKPIKQELASSTNIHRYNQSTRKLIWAVKFYLSCHSLSTEWEIRLKWFLTGSYLQSKNNFPYIVFLCNINCYVEASEWWMYSHW